MDNKRLGCFTLVCITGILVIGELVGSAISKPIAMWRGKKDINVENLASLIDVMNQRICDLEDWREE